MSNQYLIHTTEDGVQIYVEPGSKSPHDFKVRYREPNKRLRTPKHIHLITDLYIKKAFERNSTLKLIKEFLEILSKLEPTERFPPRFQQFMKKNYLDFKKLDNYGEYSVEFLVAIFDLIMIQEKTNYPNGTINKKLFEAFLQEKDIFSVIGAATFRG